MHDVRATSNRSRAGFLAGGIFAILLAALTAPPAAAQDPDEECRVDVDGMVICPEMTVEGQLRTSPEVFLGRESLDSPIGDLRASFLDEIESSVRADPF
jgi:hypothetical protein